MSVTFCPKCGIHHEETAFCHGTVHQLPQKKQVLRLITKMGHVFDFPTPPDFSMSLMMTSVRSAGYMMNEAFFCPYDNIGTFFIYQSDAPPKGDNSNVVQFGELQR